jgi:hypothetical protein
VNTAELSKPGRVGKSTPAEHFSESSSSHNISTNAPSVVQVNQLTTSALLLVIGVLVLSCAISVGAWGVATHAERQAQNAEREARVAMDKAEELRVQVGALQVLVGIDIARKETP